MTMKRTWSKQAKRNLRMRKYMRKYRAKKDREIKARRKAYAKKRMGRFLRTLKKALYNEYVRGYMSGLRKAEK